MKTYDWTSRLKELYQKALLQYRAGNRMPDTFFTPEETEFLAEIGAHPMELYDYAEDAEALDWETALLIVSVRRDYYLHFLHRAPSGPRLTMGQFPAKDAELDGIPWLPRLILKAKSRLRGEMPLDMMYCCGGDRRFFKQHDIHPADFLRFVWASNGDDARLLEYVRGKR
ncbi:MAG: hypothetical protein WCP06_12755 [Verrucomicrobiota bacterium]